MRRPKKQKKDASRGFLLSSAAFLLEQHDALLEGLRAHDARMAAISKQLRRDRELAFYRSEDLEDLTPGDVSVEDGGRCARDDARWLVETIIAELC